MRPGSNAASIARDISAMVAAGRAPLACRAFIQLADNLENAHGTGRLELTLAVPEAIDPGWDAAIAAVCEYRLNSEGLPIPEWVSARAGTPGELWTLPWSVYELTADRAAVPAEFLRRGILIEADTLRSV